jgi:RNA polymerase sigma factor (sigma-70 family)
MSGGNPEAREQAWAECYQRYHRVVWQHVFYIMRSISWLCEPRETAADVTSDIFVGLPDAARRYVDDGRAEYWLKRVAIRTALRKKEQLTGDWRSKRRDASDPVEEDAGKQPALRLIRGNDPAAQGASQARSYVQWDEVEEQVIAAFDNVRQEQLDELNDRLAAWRSSAVEEERKWAEFIGYYVEGYDDAEIASRMGWTNQGTVRNWRSKIIRKLAELVGERRA